MGQRCHTLPDLIGERYQCRYQVRRYLTEENYGSLEEML